MLARLADRSGIDARWCAAFEEDRGFFYGGDEIPGTAARMGLWLRAAKAMGREACTQALARANVAADRVTHVVTASCTGFAAPSVDAHLIESLGLPRHVQRLIRRPSIPVVYMEIGPTERHSINTDEQLPNTCNRHWTGCPKGSGSRSGFDNGVHDVDSIC